MSDILVVKIGGSTLGSHDTTLEDLVALQRRGLQPVVVHGGGALSSEWLSRHNVPTRFERGLRVTDAESLKVVVAVLAGLVNKELVASLASRGAKAIGLSGADGGMLRARIFDEKLAFVGEITGVDPAPLRRLLGEGMMPVIAPVALQSDSSRSSGQLLNTNADTAAGALAVALRASRLVFLTDVPGVKSDGAVLPRLTPDRAKELMEAGGGGGGVVPE